MTDKQLNETLQSHKQWLGNRHGAGKRADLRGADLRRANFEGADLRWCDFRAADLSGANLSKADFTNADLRGCDLRGASCVGTMFVNARLEGANMEGVDLRLAVMEYAQLAGANISHRPGLERMLEKLLEGRWQPSRTEGKQKERDLER